MVYNWQLPDCPHFQYNLLKLEGKLYKITTNFGKISGYLVSLPEDQKLNVIIEFMVREVIKTSEIEGEYSSRSDIMSSIQSNVGLHAKQELQDARAGRIANLLMDVRNSYAESLISEKLFAWHKNGSQEIYCYYQGF